MINFPVGLFHRILQAHKGAEVAMTPMEAKTLMACPGAQLLIGINLVETGVAELFGRLLVIVERPVDSTRPS